MNKSDLRKKAMNTLKALTSDERLSIEQGIYNHLFNSAYWKNAKTIGVTVSRGFEWETRPIIEKGWQENKTIVVPKCMPETKGMQFYILTSFDQLESVYFGLQEPDPELTLPVGKHTIDLLLVPGLLYNLEGFRIGFGGGFYDRFLTDYEGTSMLVASVMQQHEPLPVESFDQKVDFLLTETGIKST
ncbi:5-formyltetrahydrofolate cyclo-ligase [Halobacillus fulvus]|nr:5-formyltetrahydrofolate cyclo-ligase [Halobacillus fulvus]